MAKIDTKLFERVGYNLGMSRLVKDMQYVDYTKTLKQELNNVKTTHAYIVTEKMYDIILKNQLASKRQILPSKTLTI